MATKEKQTTQNKAAQETWRKPLQVPPRSNAMRNFYQGAEESADLTADKEELSTLTSFKEEIVVAKPVQEERSQISSMQADKVKVEAKSQKGISEPRSSGKIINSNAGQPNKLAIEDLSMILGFEIEELFDVHELLRGKSLEIYQTLLKSSDEKGRCKITQPELMKQTGIKNRRTFYKHEQWLINLNLLEKRHLPGDHKGVVYRVFEIYDVLPVPSEMMEQFDEIFKNSE